MSLINLICVVFYVSPCFGNISIKFNNSIYGCNETLTINENGPASIVFTTKNYIDRAWCSNSVPSVTKDLNINRGKTHYMDINGTDTNEGSWSCVFLYNSLRHTHGVSPSHVYYYDEKEYMYHVCNVIIEIKRYIMLKVYGKTGVIGQVMGRETITLPYSELPNSVTCTKYYEVNNILKNGHLFLVTSYTNAISQTSVISNSTSISIINWNINERKDTDRIAELLHSNCTFVDKYGVKTIAQVKYKRVFNDTSTRQPTQETKQISNEGNWASNTIEHKEPSNSYQPDWLPKQTTTDSLPFAAYNKYTSKSKVELTLSAYEAGFAEVINYTCVYNYTLENGPLVFRIYINDQNDKYMIRLAGETVSRIQYEGFFVMNFTHDVFSYCEVWYNGKKISFEHKKITYSPTIEHEVIKNAETSESSSGFENEYIIYSTIGAGVFIIVILTIASFRACRQSADKRKQSSVIYENLDNGGDTPTPSFPQGPRLEETYLSPSDCLRNEIDDTYAQPYKPKIEDLYSTPLPKNQRLDNSRLYEQVVPKTDCNVKSYVNTLKQETEGHYSDVNLPKQHYEVSEGNYAEVNLPKHTYVNKNDEDYTNVFKNEPYYNSKENKSDDYTEPAYCQLSRKD